VVFHVRDKARLLNELDRARKSHLAATGVPKAERTEYTVAGRKVLRTRAGHSVDQHLLDLGDVIVVANARSLITKFVAVADGKARSLATSGDFRYMRTIYPYSPKDEDGFIFIGDAFVASAISPRAKILQSRRMFARAELQAVGGASLLHGLLEGTPPANAKALVASGLLTAADLVHADGGASIQLDPATGASSAQWGSLRGMTPLGELKIDRVSVAEQKAY
jgi:hypothetical protein